MSGWTSAEKILAIRLDAMGDVLMTEPAIRAVAESQAGPRITLLTSPAGAEVGKLLPGVDAIIAYEAPWMKTTSARASAQPDWDMLDRLRSERFDGAIVFTVYSQNPLPAALLCFLAGIPLRLAHCRENPYQLLTDWAEETEPEMQTRHEVRRQLDLVAGISCCTDDETMRLRLPAEVRQRVAHTCDRLDLGAGQRWAVVHPGASAASRRYPLGLFAQVCRQLVDAHGLRLIFTGTRPEKSLSDEIRAGIGAGSDSLAGELTVVELAALLERAPLLIANNTGPVHLAAAVGCPVVDLYALTNPQHTPWLVPHRVLYHDVPCRWCYKSVCPQEHHDCLEKVPPEAVVAAAIELLATRG